MIFPILATLALGAAAAEGTAVVAAADTSNLAGWSLIVSALASCVIGVGTIWSGFKIAAMKMQNETAALERTLAAQDRKEAKAKLEIVAEKVAVVAEKQKDSTKVSDEKLDWLHAQQSAMSEINQRTYALVNSNMGVQLRLYAVAMMRIHGLTGDPHDGAIAKEALAAWEAHEEQQRKLDAERGFVGMPAISTNQKVAQAMAVSPKTPVGPFLKPLGKPIGPFIESIIPKSDPPPAPPAPAVPAEQPSVIVPANKLHDDQIEEQIAALQALKSGKPPDPSTPKK